MTTANRGRWISLAFWVAAAGAFIVVASNGIDAHKGNTSKYTYNDDVYPILRDKCGRCHAEGGPTPMSLLNYNSVNGGAVAWAESIREMLVSESMPPWYADSMGPAVRNAHDISPREMDVVITWAAGGTPHGDLNHKPIDAPYKAAWALGKPDLSIPLDKEVTLPAGTMESTEEFTLATNLTEAKWVKAADLLPTTPSIVRNATISVADGPLLALWEPADDANAAPNGTAFKLPAGVKLHVQIHYKKGWTDEQASKSDRSTIGLYFTDEPLSGKSIQSFSVDGPAGNGEAMTERSFGGAVPAAGRILAIRPLVDQAYAHMSINAVTASGKKVPLLKLRGQRPEWPRRYWLADPIELPAGTKIEVTGLPGDPDMGPLTKATGPLQVSFDYVAQ